MSYLANRIKNVNSSGIRKIFDLAATMKDPINLSIGQADFDVPECVANDMIKAIKEGNTRYTVTQGLLSLRERILKKYYNDKYSLENIIITSGVSGAILLAYMSLLNEGDNIILFDPYFVLYEQLANLFGATVSLVDTYPSNFKITKEALEKSYKEKTKFIMLNSPANPSGMVYSEEEVKIVAEFAKKHNILVISDEIYSNFVYDEKFVSIANYYENVLILNGFSKVFAIAGERLGYAVGPKDIIKEMIKLQQFTFVCAPTSVQYAVANNLDFNFTPILDRYKIKRDIVYNALRDITDLPKPLGAFYAFPVLKNNMTGTEFSELAIKNRVLVVPGIAFSKHDKAFRISFAAKDETLKEGMRIIKNLLS